ncbi:hypothetical protein CYANOKiyG1_58500 [Okeania sp. KiyG1]|nr:hypothetical protein CYANOKiyG1_58500 [Okeania sp. KiyG1]
MFIKRVDCTNLEIYLSIRTQYIKSVKFIHLLNPTQLNLINSIAFIAEVKRKKAFSYLGEKEKD